MVEEWRDVVGYEGRYRVSNLGYVESYKTGRCMIPQSSGKSGYLQVRFDGRNHRIHRMVAQAFLAPELDEVNHLDSDRHNNRLDNLEWCTRKQNMQHALANGRLLLGEDNPRSKLTERSVRFVREYKQIGLKQAAISRLLGMDHVTVWTIFHGKTWKHVEVQAW